MTGCLDELAFSFTDCAPVPLGPQISIKSDLSDRTDRSGYAFIAQAACDFHGWITVTACTVVRNVVRAFRRIICESKAVFNRRVLIRQGGLRL